MQDFSKRDAKKVCIKRYIALRQVYFVKKKKKERMKKKHQLGFNMRFRTG